MNNVKTILDRIEKGNNELGDICGDKPEKKMKNMKNSKEYGEWVRRSIQAIKRKKPTFLSEILYPMWFQDSNHSDVTCK